jgi:ABC-type antimicrobial peptide transport system permease subunit
MLAIFAALAALLALVGVLGVLSVVVSRRLREMGVRVALGAPPRHVRRLVVRAGMVPVAVGTTVGIVAATAATRLLAAQVHGVSRLDPWSFAMAAVAFLLVSALVCLWPAARAARVDPVTVLRGD